MNTFLVAKAYDSYIEANLMLSFLQDSNINCHLKDENTVLADPFLSNAIGGIKLMVYHTQLERALELIREFEKK
jgi:type III secretory pathway lipoprotein EscJ